MSSTSFPKATCQPPSRSASCTRALFVVWLVVSLTFCRASSYFRSRALWASRRWRSRFLASLSAWFTASWAWRPALDASLLMSTTLGTWTG